MKMKEEASNFFKEIDLNKPNIVLGKANAILAFTQLYQFAYESDIINNEYIILPFPTFHHTNFKIHFKGQLLENGKTPFILTQSKEFLEDILSLPNDNTTVSTNFDVLLLSFTEGNGLSLKRLSKEEAKELMLQGKDLRDC